MQQHFVSIIIPTFNRAHLIEETLDSIFVQTYQNWECIVVDDGSTDNSQAVFVEYKDKDPRFRFFSRPNYKPKGANACRNVGLEKAQGDYVMFFDSDDLMTENHLEIKVNAIQKFDCDYVITKTQYFNHSNANINRYYQFDKFPITPFNYITQKINWLTCDICLKTSLAKSISFNENLHSGQEYNYFSKLVHISVKGEFKDQIVTLRRYHETSIRSQLKCKDTLNESYFNANWYTYLDLKNLANKNVLKYFIQNCISLSYKLKSIPIPAFSKALFIKEVFYTYGFKGINFIFMFIGLKVFNKGHFFRQKLLEKKSS